MNNRTILAASIALLTSAQAESSWLKTYGTPDDDSYQGITSLSQGGYGISGRTSNANWYGLLDAKGNVVWSKSSGSVFVNLNTDGSVNLFNLKQVGSDFVSVSGKGRINLQDGSITDVVIDKDKKITGNDGDFVYSSSSQTIEGTWKTSASNTDTAFAKMDSANTLVWSHLYDLGTKDSGQIFPFNSGYLLTNSDLNIDPTTYSAIWTVTFTKLDVNGAIITGSSKKITGDYASFSQKVLNDGSFLLFGYADKSFNLIKLDSAFNYVWGKQYISNNTNEKLHQNYNIIEGSNGNLEINAYLQRYENTSLVEQHPVQIKIDSSTGNILTKKEVKIRKLDPYGFNKTATGNYLLDGSISNTNTNNGNNNPDSDGLFGLFNSSLDVVWLRSLVGTGYDHLNRLDSSQNSFYISGETDSWGAGKRDQLFGKLDSTGNIANCPAIKNEPNTIVDAEISVVDIQSPLLSTADPKDNGAFNVTVTEQQSTIDLAVTDFPITSQDICSAADPNPTGSISFSTITVDFGSVALKQAANLDLTLNNTGEGALKINSLSVPVAPFSKVTDNCTASTIVAGGSCKVTYKFAPTTAGSFSQPITISSDDPSNASSIVTLIGTGGGTTTPATVQALSETDVGVGSKLTITGKGFGAKKNKVLIGKKAATLISWNDSSIVVKLPALAAKSYDVKVVTKAKTNATILAGQITLHKPEISSADKIAGPKNTVLTISGNYFGIGVKPKVYLVNGKSRTAATVKPGTNSLIAIKIPKLAKAADYTVLVSNSAGSSSSSFIFTYQK